MLLKQKGLHMRKLETSKSNWILGAKVDFLREGLMRGALAVEISMSGDASKGSFEDVAAMVEQLIKTKLPQRRMVRFVGNMVDMDPNFSLLIKSLYDYGFELQVVVNDGFVYSWMQWVSWVIVKTKATVVMTSCDEVWYVHDQLPEEDITLPLRPNRPTFCFVSGKLDITEVDAFMCRSKHQWGLL